MMNVIKEILVLSACVFIVEGSVVLTTPSNACVGSPLSMSCDVEPQTSQVKILHPDGTNAASCNIPLPTTVCSQISTYTTVPTVNGTVTTFVLSIPTVDKDKHNGNWTCQHGLTEESVAVVSVISPLADTGKEPTMTTDPSESKKDSNVTVSGHVYCQSSDVSTEILYSEKDGSYKVLELQPNSWSTSDLGSNGCDTGESNRTYTITISKSMEALKGKKVKFSVRFNLTACGTTFTANSTLEFTFSADSQTTTDLDTTSTDIQTTTNPETTSTDLSTTTNLETTTATETSSVTMTTTTVVDDSSSTGDTTSTYLSTTTDLDTTTATGTSSVAMTTTTTVVDSSSTAESISTTKHSTTQESTSTSLLSGDEIVIVTVGSVVGLLIIFFIVVILIYVIRRKYERNNDTGKEKVQKSAQKNSDNHISDNWTHVGYVTQQDKYRHQNPSPRRKMNTHTYTGQSYHPRSYDNHQYNRAKTIGAYYPKIYGDYHNYGFEIETSPYEKSYQFYTGSSQPHSYYHQYRPVARPYAYYQEREENSYHVPYHYYPNHHYYNYQH